MINVNDKYVRVRWNGTLSASVSVKSGVRQGGSLSPALFNVFVNDSINNVKKSGKGCNIDDFYLGIIMYADDILLLSPTVLGLQKQMDICGEYFTNCRLDFNASKSVCLAFGPAHGYNIKPMLLQGGSISWVKSFKYLGIVFKAGKNISVDIEPIKRKFYASCYSIFGKTAHIDELTRLYLLEVNCLPLLTYALPALSLSQENIRELNVAWNSAYRKIFAFNRWDSVKSFIAGLGKLDFKHIRLKLCTTFVSDNIGSFNGPFNHLLFRYYVSDFINIWRKDVSTSDHPKLHIVHYSHHYISQIIQDSFKLSSGI